MDNFWNSLVESTSLVNSATIISLLLAVIFFVYQEYRSRKSHAKETLRLRDEITSLIIRNHVNNEVPVSRIDLQSIISGFENFKNSKLKMNNVEIIEMVYARVYENEHISNHMRLQLLKELEEIKDSYKIGLLQNNEINEKMDAFITPRMSVAISMIMFLGINQLANYLIQRLQLNDLYIAITITVLFSLVVYIRPFIDRFLNFIFEIIVEVINRKNNNTIPEKNINPQNKDSIKTSIDTSKEILFENLFKNKEEIYEVFGQRIIIEKLLRQLYFEVFQEEVNFPISRIISLLNREKVLSGNASTSLKRAYYYSSFVVHEGHLPPEMHSFNDLINFLKEHAYLINNILIDYKSQT